MVIGPPTLVTHQRFGHLICLVISQQLYRLTRPASLLLLQRLNLRLVALLQVQKFEPVLLQIPLKLQLGPLLILRQSQALLLTVPSINLPDTYHQLTQHITTNCLLLRSVTIAHFLPQYFDRSLRYKQVVLVLHYTPTLIQTTGFTVNHIGRIVSLLDHRNTVNSWLEAILPSWVHDGKNHRLELE